MSVTARSSVTTHLGLQLVLAQRASPALLNDLWCFVNKGDWGGEYGGLIGHLTLAEVCEFTQICSWELLEYTMGNFPNRGHKTTKQIKNMTSTDKDVKNRIRHTSLLRINVRTAILRVRFF